MKIKLIEDGYFFDPEIRQLQQIIGVKDEYDFGEVREAVNSILDALEANGKRDTIEYDRWDKADLWLIERMKDL
jgi:hypothetical protein